jgi:YVTN family beta-propeller protein
MCFRTGGRRKPVFGAFTQKNANKFRVVDLRSNFFQIFLLSVFGAFAGQVVLHAGSASAETRPGFHIQEQWNLGGKAGWGPLLFDSPSHLLYVPRTDRVMVLDTESGKVTGEITGFIDARDVALDDSGKYGFVTDITDGTVGFVRVFDRSTLKLVSTIPVGRIPGAIVFDPATKNVFAFSSRDRNVSVIDTKTNLVVETIPLPGKPHIAVTDGKGTIFVGLRGIGQMARIDTASGKLIGTWPTSPCAEFTGLTVDTAHRQLLGSCADRKLISVNADSGAVALIGESGIGAGDLAFDPRNGLLISAANSGVLTVFHQESANRYARQEEVSTLPRAGTLALDPNRSRVYLVTAKFQQRQVIGPGMEEAESRLTPVPDSIVVLVVGP